MGRLRYEQTRNVRDRDAWRHAAEEQVFRESVRELELAVRLRRDQELRAGFSRGSEGEDGRRIVSTACSHCRSREPGIAAEVAQVDIAPTARRF